MGQSIAVVVYPLLEDVFRVSISDGARRLVAKCEFGIAEEGCVGGGDEPTCHLKDRVRGSGLGACGRFLRLRFLFGRQRFGQE